MKPRKSRYSRTSSSVRSAAAAMGAPPAPPASAAASGRPAPSDAARPGPALPCAAQDYNSQRAPPPPRGARHAGTCSPPRSANPQTRPCSLPPFSSRRPQPAFFPWLPLAAAGPRPRSHWPPATCATCCWGRGGQRGALRPPVGWRRRRRRRDAGKSFLPLRAALPEPFSLCSHQLSPSELLALRSGSWGCHVARPHAS